MDVLKTTRGVTIECEDNTYVVDATVVPLYASGLEPKLYASSEWVAPPALVAAQTEKAPHCGAFFFVNSE